MGLNHSDSNLVMRLPKEKLVFIVDTIPVGAFPGRGFIDVYPLETEQFMERVLKMDWERMIPGHPGQPGDRLGTKKDVEDQLALIRHASDTVQKWAREGKCWEPAEKEVKLEKYESWPGYQAGLPLVVRRYLRAFGAAEPRGFHRLLGEDEVFPGLGLVLEGAQQIRRMVGHDQRHAGVAVHPAAQAGNRGAGFQQRLRGEAPHREDQLRLDQLDLLQEMRAALRDFLRRRVAVSRRAALEHVRDVDVGAARKADRRQHVVEQLARLADERIAEAILFRARRLADQHPVGVLVADAEHGLGARLVQAAFHAARDRCLQRNPANRCDFRDRGFRLQPPNGRDAHLRQHLRPPAHASCSVSTSASSRPWSAG